MTKFISLRNFWCASHGDVRLGDVLDLTDAEARVLVALGDTVEPVAAEDRKRIVTGSPRIQWETTPKEKRGFAGPASWSW